MVTPVATQGGSMTVEVRLGVRIVPRRAITINDQTGGLTADRE
jgi:hypothetical protein